MANRYRDMWRVQEYRSDGRKVFTKYNAAVPASSKLYATRNAARSAVRNAAWQTGWVKPDDSVFIVRARGIKLPQRLIRFDINEEDDYSHG